MEKKKVKYGKIILIAICLMAIILLIMTSRKMIIIKNLQSKISKYINTKNYHITMYNYEREELQIFDTYKKDERSLVVFKVLDNEQKKKLVNYSDKNQTNTYIEINQEKIAILNNKEEVFSPVQISTPLYANNVFELIAISIVADIETEECNGKECYKIKYPNFIYNKEVNNTFYLEKETGLLIRAFEGTSEKDGEIVNLIIDYKYEFDTVTDEQLQEPDVTQYKIQESNS